MRLAQEQEHEAQGWTGVGAELLGGLLTGMKLPTGSGIGGAARSGAAYGGPLSVVVFDEGGPYLLTDAGRAEIRREGATA